MNPDNGAHTSWPLGKIIVPDFVTDTDNDNSNTTRDIVVVTSEATAQFCSEFRHLTFLTDVSTEASNAIWSPATRKRTAAAARAEDGPVENNQSFKSVEDWMV